MKKTFFIIALYLLFTSALFAQLGINTDGSQPVPSAGLDVKFTDKGLLPPRMARANMEAIPNPANGLIIYCNDCSNSGTGAMAMFINGAWNAIVPTCTAPPPPAAGTHVPEATHIYWNWNTVPGATGYKWNMTNDYATAADMGTSNTKFETGLSCNTPYSRYVWSYNTCDHSTVLVLTKSTLDCSYLICPPVLTDTRDGQTYNTVLIGSQCWMAQNLNIGTQISISFDQYNHSAIEKHCYNDYNSSCSDYGGLYQWSNMMQWSTTPGAQGICPTGWHIPTDGEWTILTTMLGGEYAAGGKMKEAGTTHWRAPNTGATNTSGFSARAGGHGLAMMFFSNGGESAYFWSSGPEDVGGVWVRNLGFNYEIVTRYCDSGYSNSVRCVLD